MKILTWLLDFLVISLYLVWFSSCSSRFWELRDNGAVKKNWKPQSHVRSLIYRSGAISRRVCSHNPSLPALFPVARDHWKAETKLVPIIPLSRFSLVLGAREFHNPHLVLGKPVEEAPSLDSHYDFSLVTGIPLLKSVPPTAWEGRALITCTSQWYRD